MAFIGKQPTIGNFVKLDAISTSSTNTYNLTLDSVAFSPESPNHCMVSLNGVIQSPSTSFSISGSTITFIPSSGTLSSSDSIDFIMVYGNVLDLGVPSDATVTNAKTNFVSTSSAAGLQIKGDGTTDGTLQLNCSQNSHGIKLKSPAHSASASYTLTFPTTDGSANEFLKTDGSGVLSWASAGGSNTPLFFANAGSATSIANNSFTKVEFTNEVLDTANNFASSRFTPTTAGKYVLHFSVGLNTSSSASAVYPILFINGAENGNATRIRKYHNGGGGSIQTYHTTAIVSANGTGDYYEVYFYQNAGSTKNTYNSTNDTFFFGYKLIE